MKEPQVTERRSRAIPLTVPIIKIQGVPHIPVAFGHGLVLIGGELFRPYRVLDRGLTPEPNQPGSGWLEREENDG